ncbi:MAG: hypothetical protein ABL936_00385 [Aestuariivirga sp.]
MLTTKGQWRNLALGLAAIYIGFVTVLAWGGVLISPDECPLVPDSTVLYKTPPPE